MGALKKMMALTMVFLLLGCAADLAKSRRIMGTQSMEKKEYESAISDFKAAIDLEPGNARNYKLLGNAYYQKGRYEKAAANYEKAVELAPDNFEYLHVYLFDLGDAYLESGQFRKAVETYQKAISLKPTEAKYFNQLAYCQIKLGQYEEAALAAKRAIELKPDYAIAYNNLGYAYGLKGAYGDALKAFEKALRLRPTEALYYDNAGKFLLEKRDYKKAVQYLKKAVELAPANRSYLFRLSTAYFLQGKYDQALEVQKKAISQMTFIGIGTRIQIKENYPVVYSINKAGPAEKAGVRKGDKIIEIDGKSTRGWELKEVISHLRGKEDTKVSLTIQGSDKGKPFEILVTREKINPKEASPYFAYQSLILRKLRKNSEALKDAEKAYSLDPSDKWARLALGAARLDQGRYEEALELLSQVKESSHARILEATALAKKGDYQKAVAIYTSIEEELSPKDVPLWNDRATLLVALRAYADSKRQEAARLKARGRYKEALKELGALMKVADDTGLKALCREIAGIMAIDPGLSVIPEEARKYALRGDVMTEEGNFEAAIKEYRQAIEAAPYIAKLHFNTAMLYGELKKYSQAIRYMKTYLMLAPEAPNVRAAKDQIYKWELMMEKGEQK